MTFDIPADCPPAKCRTCNAAIFWITTAKGKLMPVDPTGFSHFSTCPQAAEHRKPR